LTEAEIMDKAQLEVTQDYNEIKKDKQYVLTRWELEANIHREKPDLSSEEVRQLAYEKWKELRQKRLAAIVKSGGTTKQERPSQVIRMINENVLEGDLPTVAPTMSPDTSRAFETQAENVLINQGDGPEVTESDIEGKVTKDSQMSEEAKESWRVESRKRGMESGGRGTEGRLRFLQAISSMVKGLRNQDAQGFLGLFRTLNERFHLNLWIPDPPEEKFQSVESVCLTHLIRIAHK